MGAERVERGRCSAIPSIFCSRRRGRARFFSVTLGPVYPGVVSGRGYKDTGRGYMGGSLNRWILSRETAISRHSWCRTFAWRQSSAPKPQAISQPQALRPEILSLSSSSSSLMPIYLPASFIRPSEKCCALCNSCRNICPLPAISTRFQCLRFWGNAEMHATLPNAGKSSRRTNRTRNGIVFNLALDSLPAPQPMIVAKEEPHDDHHHYRL